MATTAEQWQAVYSDFERGLSLKEISERHGIAYDTVRKHMSAKGKRRYTVLEAWQWKEAETDYILGADLRGLSERYGCSLDAMRAHMVKRRILPWYERPRATRKQ